MKYRLVDIAGDSADLKTPSNHLHALDALLGYVSDKSKSVNQFTVLGSTHGCVRIYATVNLQGLDDLHKKIEALRMVMGRKS